MYGWNVSSIRADMGIFERNEKINEFNDPYSTIDILLTSMDLSAFGLNLHNACHKGIIVQWPWSANHLMQILGRLPRIGQKRYVEWIIYTMPGTLYDSMQTIVWSKYARQLAVESRIHEDVRGVLADIASYTLLFNLFSMPHHRWLWDRKAFNLDVYGSLDDRERPQKLSVFFQHVGQMAVSSVPQPNDPSFVHLSCLCDRTSKDFVAGAVIWLKAGKPEISWDWLAVNCSLERLADELREPWISNYLDDILRHALLGGTTPNTMPVGRDYVPPSEPIGGPLDRPSHTYPLRGYPEVSAGSPGNEYATRSAQDLNGMTHSLVSNHGRHRKRVRLASRPNEYSDDE
ncbi:hypothetical protein F4776DRAFT_669579 [Hypoxylon sp. NC0597]|nr:hypothetical protein F4776DRAFT_669579 [Hypoxylon sp. NC0597]